MAPSRGLLPLRHVVWSPARNYNCLRCTHRLLSTLSSFTSKLADPANKVQSYISRSDDPYFNLSIEEYIRKKSPPESVVLFLYTNRPCVVVGRNQNPWLEVNLGILDAAKSRDAKDTEPPGIGSVDLLRRRSGGGTVFHDEGNVNWSVVVPFADFTRDRHAEMVVRALRKLGVDRARVNERHDIVLDQGFEKRDCDPEDTHRTPYTVEGSEPRPLKVSGSAYKFTKGRALHHATTLLASPNLHIIPQYLRSPARGFITAKGVESVSSPVGNIGLQNEVFQRAVQKEFAAMYTDGGHGGESAGLQTVELGEEHSEIPELAKEIEVMKNPDWVFSQTPQFTVSGAFLNSNSINMTVRHGVIESCDFGGMHSEIQQDLQSLLVGRKIQDIRDWTNILEQGRKDRIEARALGKWLNGMMYTPDVAPQVV